MCKKIYQKFIVIAFWKVLKRVSEKGKLYLYKTQPKLFCIRSWNNQIMLPKEKPQLFGNVEWNRTGISQYGHNKQTWPVHTRYVVRNMNHSGKENKIPHFVQLAGREKRLRLVTLLFDKISRHSRTLFSWIIFYILFQIKETVHNASYNNEVHRWLKQISCIG